MGLAASLVAPAMAESPGWLRVGGGFGLGGARYHELSYAQMSGLLSVDFGWSDEPGRAFVLSYDNGGHFDLATTTPSVSSLQPDYRTRMRGASHQAIAFGIERSRPAGVSPYVHGGVGLGLLRTNFRTTHDTRPGLAVTGSAGVRLAPDPGPLGLVLSLRTSHVVAHKSRSHVVFLLQLGLIVYPR